MKFTITREVLYRPLQRIVGAVEKKQTLPILSNVLIAVKHQLLSLVGTDLEVEVVARLPLFQKAEPGEVTVSARKLLDVCRALSDGTEINFSLQADGSKLLIKSASSRFSLACLPADDFPKIEEGPGRVELSFSSEELQLLFERTSFSMAQQDVRYYLNGLSLTFSGAEIRSVATDGHRLVLQSRPAQMNLSEPLSVIIPRKAVLELERLFSETKEDIGVVVCDSHLRVISTGYSFSTRLVEGKFPSYQRALPQGTPKKVLIQRELLKQALGRVAVVLADTRLKGARFLFTSNHLNIQATNAEKDEVEEDLEIEYQGPSLEIGLNVMYLQDYLSVVDSETILLSLFDPDTSVLLEPVVSEQKLATGEQYTYVVMPMRL